MGRLYPRHHFATKPTPGAGSSCVSIAGLAS